MAQIDPRNLNCKVVVGAGRVVFLRDLLPDHWLTLGKNTEQGVGD
jgi:hypothetical protein